MLIAAAVFVFAWVVQLVNFIVFLSALRRKAPAAQGYAGPVSVIVCAHDEEQNLRELLPLLVNQAYPDFEIIIVNDRSNDNTYDLLLEESARNARVRMVNVKDTPAHVNGKKFALTLGIRAASSDVIILTDADCRPGSPDWLRSMSDQFSPETQFVLGFSPYAESVGFLNRFIRFETMVTALQYLSFARVGAPYMGVGRNLAYRKSLFLDKKGFNNHLHVIGGDDDLFVNQHATRSNTKIALSPESLTISKPETTLSEFVNQKVRHLSVGRYYKIGDKVRLGVFHFSWILTLFVGLPLVFFFPYYYGIIGLLLVRWGVMAWTFHTLVKQSGLKFNLWVLPALDFLYSIYYISTGLVTLFTKKVRWKKK